MKTPNKKDPPASVIVIVTAKDLPLHCPMPSASIWDSHPRVFIDIATTGEAKCPYCGTTYKLNGPVGTAH